jgi:phage tail sheath protein FI
MTDFNANNKTPGVYIQEIDRPGPIAGVGTSTAGIIGPAVAGPIGVPTFLTNLTEFESIFGTFVVGPPIYSTHAVHGFFANGGSTMYFVRVGTGANARLSLNDSTTSPGAPTLVVTARQEGSAGNFITVQAQDSSPLSNTTVVKNASDLAGSGAAGDVVEVTAVAGFKPGDEVEVVVGANPAERRTVKSIDSGGKKLTLNTPLSHNGATGTVRIADLTSSQKTFRVAAVDKLEPGSYVSIVQGGTKAFKVVGAVEPVNRFITLAESLGSSFSLAAADPDVDFKSLEFDLKVNSPGNPSETFAQMAMDPRHSRYYRKIFDSKYVNVNPVDPPNQSAPPTNRPVAAGPSPLAGGADDNRSAIGPAEYAAALTALEKIDDVNILLAPDSTDLVVQKSLIDHCEKMKDRFAILDPKPGATPADITAQRKDPLINSDRGFAALYYPRIVVTNPLGDGFLVVPPSGHIAGLYARVDDEKGVFKAPANETLRNLVGLERVLSDDENGPLNEIGVNVIRSFVGRGIRVWGARTIAPAAQTQWRYINVRRLMLFIEESLQEGTLSAVFEPNNEGLWETLKRTINGFLHRVWQSGALVGIKPEEAFRVRIDRELNPPEVRALGQLVIEVRVAPTTPAEFIVFRIIQQPGEPIIEE